MNPPNTTPFPIITTFSLSRFKKTKSLDVNALSVTILDLIRRGFISVEIKDKKDLMGKINLRIKNNHNNLEFFEISAIQILKHVTKSNKFSLKDLNKHLKNKSTASRFIKDFNSRTANVLRENQELTYDRKEWKSFKNFLENEASCDIDLVYAACFGIDEKVVKNIISDSNLFIFMINDGYKLLNQIFKVGLQNYSKSKGDGIFYDINDKYTIPGGG